MSLVHPREIWTILEIFDERLELCHRALVCRHERLEGTPSDVAPILWQHGALARLKKARLLINCFMVVILRSLSDMRDCVNVSLYDR